MPTPGSFTCRTICICRDTSGTRAFTRPCVGNTVGLTWHLTYIKRHGLPLLRESAGDRSLASEGAHHFSWGGPSRIRDHGTARSTAEDRNRNLHIFVIQTATRRCVALFRHGLHGPQVAQEFLGALGLPTRDAGNTLDRQRTSVHGKVLRIFGRPSRNTPLPHHSVTYANLMTSLMV